MWNFWCLLFSCLTLAIITCIQGERWTKFITCHFCTGDDCNPDKYKSEDSERKFGFGGTEHSSLHNPRCAIVFKPDTRNQKESIIERMGYADRVNFSKEWDCRWVQEGDSEFNRDDNGRLHFCTCGEDGCNKELPSCAVRKAENIKWALCAR